MLIGNRAKQELKKFYFKEVEELFEEVVAWEQLLSCFESVW